MTKRRKYSSISKVGLAIIVVVVVACVVVLSWQMQAGNMEGDFAEALRSNRVETLPPELRGKLWTDEELATVYVKTLPRSSGPPQALSRTVYLGTEFTISKIEYSYQAAIRDDATGKVHVFGYSRAAPNRWRWVTIHPDSMQQHIEERIERASQSGER